MVLVENVPLNRVCQGDIFSNIKYVEYLKEKDEIITFSEIEFPLIIVLTQDCDLQQDEKVRQQIQKERTKPEERVSDGDKLILSVLVAPLYNAEHVFNGEHLSELEITMQNITNKENLKNYIKTNQNARYYYITFPRNSRLPNSIIDFKHYFSVNVEYLKSVKSSQFVCKIGELFRESISQRFAHFLSRIGLPEILFVLSPKFRINLKEGPIDIDLKKIFEENGLVLGEDAHLIGKNGKWYLLEKDIQKYLIEDYDRGLFISKDENQQIK